MSEQQQARILIAEDEANLRLVLQKELERLGYRVQAAPDGEAAAHHDDLGTGDLNAVAARRRAGAASSGAFGSLASGSDPSSDARLGSQNARSRSGLACRAWWPRTIAVERTFEFQNHSR